MKYNDYPDASKNTSFAILKKVYEKQKTMVQAVKRPRLPIHSYAFGYIQKRYRPFPLPKGVHSYRYQVAKSKTVMSKKVKEKIEDCFFHYQRVKPLILQHHKNFPIRDLEEKLKVVAQQIDQNHTACLLYNPKSVTMLRYEEEVKAFYQALLDLLGAVLEDVETGTIELSKEKMIKILKEMYTLLDLIFKKLG